MSFFQKVYTFIKKKLGLYMSVLLFPQKNKEPISTTEAMATLRKYYEPKETGVFIKAAQQESDLDVSFIIPVYNGEKYLNKCLDSVVNQKTKYSYEIICVNDGSTDRSEEILKEYLVFDNFKYVTKANGGISSAYNYGISLARGRYISFLDDDDYVADGFIEIMISNAITNNADISKCGYYAVSNNKVKRAYVEGRSKSFNSMGLSMVCSYNGFSWGAMIKKSLFSNMSFPVGYWYEDMITRLVLYPQCKVFSYVSLPLYYYRFHENNSSAIVWKSSNYKSLDQYFLATECLKWLENKKIRFSTGLCLAFQYELCNMLYARTIRLGDSAKQCVFFLACETNDKLVQLCPEYRKSGNLIQRRLTQTLINRDYDYWKRICKYLVV